VFISVCKKGISYQTKMSLSTRDQRGGGDNDPGGISLHTQLWDEEVPDRMAFLVWKYPLNEINLSRVPLKL